ncbi:hypothetical protein ACH5RR_017507 [Cinchona calisaya]|uniref:Cystatin domain-containing protein n=1 Tax=Cinchona calisaya TaxID=153742 RepID=A0ABD2ZJ32_9GENT
MVTSRTDDNLRKRFFCCDRLQGSVGRDFFQWHDPVMCRRSRALIPGLLRGMTAKDAENEMEEFFQPTELEEAVKMSMMEEEFNRMHDDQNLCMAGAGGGMQAQAPQAGLVGLPIPKPKLVKPTDHHAIKIAEFAVKKHNEEAGTKLMFVKVVSGVKWSVVAATFYALIIKVNGHKGTYNGKALIAEAITGHKKLIYWKD